MSIKATNWAIAIRFGRRGDANMKLVMWIVADHADDEGLCWPSIRRIAEKAELSTSTVKRKLKELADLGVLVRCKRFQRDGARISDEIHLRIDTPFDFRDDKDIQAPPCQADTGVDDDDEDLSHLTPPPGQDCDTAPGSLLTPQVEPSFEPPCEPSPPTPQRGVSAPAQQKVEESEPEEFEQAWSAYTDHQTMSRPLALKAFMGQAKGDREWIVAAVPQYAADLARLKKKPKNFHVWIAHDGFKNYPKHPKPAGESPTDRVFVLADSRAFQALQVLDTIQRYKPRPAVLDDLHGGYGVWRYGGVPADLEALGDFDCRDYDKWHVVERGTKHFVAWARRIQQWTGRKHVEAEKIMLEGFSEHAMPDGSVMRAQRRTFGLRVPCLWPPLKNGTICAEGADPPPEESTAA